MAGIIYNVALVTYVIFLLVYIYHAYIYYREGVGVDDGVRITFFGLHNEDHGPGAQNVHDTNVRESLWKKYDLIVNESKKTSGFSEPALFLVAKKMPDFLGPHAKSGEQMLLKKLVEKIYSNSIPITDPAGKNHEEKEVFAYCYYYYRYLGLDPSVMLTQYLDCFENGDTLCFVGRISRYISMFEGVAKGPLGESEETQPIVFQRALHEAKVLLEKALTENPQMNEIYNSANLDLIEEQRLLMFLVTAKNQIKRQLKKNFKLSPQEIENILIAVD